MPITPFSLSFILFVYFASTTYGPVWFASTISHVVSSFPSALYYYKTIVGEGGVDWRPSGERSPPSQKQTKHRAVAADPARPTHLPLNPRMCFPHFSSILSPVLMSCKQPCLVYVHEASPHVLLRW